MPPTAQAPPRRRWYSPVRLAQSAAICLTGAYVTLCTFLYFDQNRLEYPRAESGAVLPLDEAIRQAQAVGLSPFRSRADAPPGTKARLLGYVQARDFVDQYQPERGTIVVFHGNGGWAAQRTDFLNAFRARGFRTFLYEYPGYGGRSGTPHESNIVPEARALIRGLDRTGAGPIYVWGESLGSGVAAAVCADPTLRVHGLVLITPWDTIANVGLYRYPFIPVKLLMADKYDSISNLEHFRHPICVIRSTEDEIIPPALSINLFAHLPDPKKLILQEGYGHDNWPNQPELAWWDDALNFTAPK